MSGIPQGGEILVNTTTAGDQTTVVSATLYTPRAIASDATGNFVITWTSAGQDGNAQGVFARLYDSAGNPLPLGEFQVNTTTLDDQKNAVVAMDADGDFVIVWEGIIPDSDPTDFTDDSKYGIYAQRYNSAGVAQGGEIRIVGDPSDPGDPVFNEQPSVAIDPDSGAFVVTWTTNGGEDIVAQRYTSGGLEDGSRMMVKTGGTNTFSSVAMAQNGNFVVVWTNDGEDGSSTGVYGRVFDSSGNIIRDEFPINTTTGGRQQSPSVAMAQNGNFVVAWESENQDGEGYGIYAQRFDSSGAPLDGEFQVNLSFYPDNRSAPLPIQEGNQRYPVVTYEPDGDSFAIAWTDDNSGITQTVVKRFNEFGTAQGVDVIANVNTTGNKIAPAIAIDSDSDFVTSWSSNNGGTTALDMYARRYGRTAADAPTDIDLTSSPAVTIDPNGPIVISEGEEAGLTVAIISGTDAETPAANLTYSLVNVTGSDDTNFDDELFTIVNGNELQLIGAPDADLFPFYRLQLRVTDANSNTYDEIFEIFVDDISDSDPTDILLSSETVNEGVPIDTLVATLSAVDPDVIDTSFTFSLITGPGDTDNGAFEIQGDQLLIKEVPDFETQQNYEIRLQVTDPSDRTYDEAVIISVVDLSDPTDITLTNDQIQENSTDLTIGTLNAIDPNNSTPFVFQLVTGIGDTDNDAFTITGDQLTIDATPDFETQNSYSIRVRVTDAENLSFEKALTITVLDQEFEVTPSNLLLDGSAVGDAIAENQPVGTAIGTFTADDSELGAGDVVTFSLVPGEADNNLFQLGGTNNNELQLNFVPDFETPPTSYTVRVIATDAGGNASAPQDFTITITDVEFELAPTDIELVGTTVDENSIVNTVVGTLSATDPETGAGDSVTLSLPAGTLDNDLFEIVGNELQIAFVPDFETRSTYNIRLQATDLGGNVYEEDFEISINNLFEQEPTAVTLTPNAIAEDSATLDIGILSATDPEAGEGDTTFTFALPTGQADNDLFSLSGNAISINAQPDFETRQTYTLEVDVTDGGGNTATLPVTVTVTNVFDVTPTNLVLTNGTTTIVENTASGTLIDTLAATDSEVAAAGDELTFRFVAGTNDNGLFQLGGTNGSEVRLAFMPDFETPQSEAGSNTYTIQVEAVDLGGNVSTVQDFTFTITDIDPESVLPPTDISLTPQDIDENEPIDSVVGILDFVDPDPGDAVTYSLPTSTPDNTFFKINGNELQLDFVPDFETRSTYNIRIRATDLGGNPYEENFEITINNLFEQEPTAVTLTPNAIAEDSATLDIGILSATDPEAGEGDTTFTFALPTGQADNDLFSLSGNAISINAQPDFETRQTYTLEVDVTDGGGNTATLPVTVTVTNVFDVTPTNLVLTNGTTTIVENTASGTLIDTLAATDSEVAAAGDALTFRFVAGTNDNGLFQLGGTNGSEVRLAFTPDFEAPQSQAGSNTYTIQVEAVDLGGNVSTVEDFTFTITDIDPEAFEPPTDITLSNQAIAENILNPVVGTLTAQDPELPNDTITFSLPTGFGDNASFDIVGTELQFVGTPDFETQSIYSIQVLATDSGGNPFAKTFTITVDNQFELAPDDIELSNTTIAENATDLTIGTLSASDPEFAEGDTTFTFTLPTGVDDNDLFSISGNVLSINAVQDFETLPNTYTIQVQVEDGGGNTFQETFTIEVTNEFDVTPTGITLTPDSILEGRPVGTSVGTLAATDPEVAEGDTITYSLPTGVADNGSFTIVGNELRLGFVPDFETRNSYTVEVVATDSGNNASTPQSLTITIQDVLETDPPTDIQLSPNRIDENVAPGTTIGTLTATDPDDTTGFTFSKVVTPGLDNDAFTVEGDQLNIAISPDFERKTLYRVRIQVADPTGNTYQEDLLVTVNNLPENRQPTDIILTSSAIAEASPAGSTVGSLVTTDLDSGDTFTYTLVDEPGLDTASFAIADNQLTINEVPDFETQSSYRIKIRSTDAGGLFREEFFDILVLNVQENNPPTSLTLNGLSVAENSPSGTVVGSFIGADPDPGDTLTYSFVAGTGDTNNGLFQIQGNQLLILESPDFETQRSYTIRVQGRDRQNNTIQQSFTISVLDQPESSPGVNSPILDLNGSAPGVNFATTFNPTQPIALMSPSATLTDPDSTNLVAAAVVISNPLDTPSEILQVDTTGTSIRADYNPTGVLTLTGNAPLAEYLQVLKTVTYFNLASFETDEPRSLVFVLDDGVNTNEVATTELTPIINNDVPGSPSDEPSLETTPRTDIINALGGDDTVTSLFEHLLQDDRIDGGDGFDRFRLTNGSGDLFVDVTGGNQISGISPTTIISNFEEFNFTGFRGNVQMTGGDVQVDRFIGGSGNDTLLGLDQSDFLSGGIGNDILDGGKGDDILDGDTGNDTLNGGEGTDTLNGGEGNDTLDGGVGTNLLRGGAGNDRYLIATTDNELVEEANAGIDEVQSSISFRLPDNIENLSLLDEALRGVGNSSNNRIRGNASNNRLLGSEGNDVLISLAGDDRLVGGAGNDRLLGGGDNDLLKGISGNDRLIAGAGNDRLLGGGGDDLLKGIGGSDRLVGGAGNDRLLGGSGNDRLTGGGGNDRLVGNSGNNTLIGNAGRDRFILGQPGSFNRVKDFSAEQNDKLVLIGRLSFGDITLSQQGANTVIFQGDTRIALIEGVAASSLSAANFI